MGDDADPQKLEELAPKAQDLFLRLAIEDAILAIRLRMLQRPHAGAVEWEAGRCQLPQPAPPHAHRPLQRANERPTWLRLAHEALDRAVLAAYAATDPEGRWPEDWADLWTETGPAQPLPDDHPLAERRRETDQHVLANLLRLNLHRGHPSSPRAQAAAVSGTSSSG